MESIIQVFGLTRAQSPKRSGLFRQVAPEPSLHRMPKPRLPDAYGHFTVGKGWRGSLFKWRRSRGKLFAIFLAELIVGLESELCINNEVFH